MRFIVRAVIAAALAGVSAAAAIYVDNNVVQIVGSIVGVFAAYVGIGVGTPVEPFVGVKARVKVPSPPAEPADAGR